ncbi:uncharacterized protein LOC121874665 [Homarus americanus]|uniref:F5/8 type C domain-containing protein n=1 Tax=Homarus americanus TaxID=6706 RepID=A0A8J5JNU2_HOMAM|nr:uncharacterized protein LOC121874665 [Homarus americanus]KAG7161822.1 hypothetical protein Hamer_G007478 [Homarus americanus]
MMASWEWMKPADKWTMMWMWAFIILIVGAQRIKIPIGLKTHCVSEVDPVVLTQNIYTLVSEIMCAALCNQKAALQYTFNNVDSSCTLDGEGLGIKSTPNKFKRSVTPDMLEEITTGKITYSSPYAATDDSGKATDRNDTTMYHSKPGWVFPWWMVDLGRNRDIHHVRILPRPGYYSFRFHHIEIRLGQVLETSGNFSSYSLFAVYNEYYKSAMMHLSCYNKEGVNARYVSIQRVTPEDDMLHILEVQVFVLIE